LLKTLVDFCVNKKIAFFYIYVIYSHFENNLYRSLKDGQVFKMNQKLKIWFFCQSSYQITCIIEKFWPWKICDNLINYLISVIFGGFINVKGQDYTKWGPYNFKSVILDRLSMDEYIYMAPIS
jgi:hypothetical protein